jgi:hypothetical protein
MAKVFLNASTHPGWAGGICQRVTEKTFPSQKIGLACRMKSMRFVEVVGLVA